MSIPLEYDECGFVINQITSSPICSYCKKIISPLLFSCMGLKRMTCSRKCGHEMMKALVKTKEFSHCHACEEKLDENNYFKHYLCGY